jgi:putative FmdB family regulatory protein
LKNPGFDPIWGEGAGGSGRRRIIRGFPFRIKGLAMPIYAYRCESCGHAKDVLQKVSDPLLTTCPACGAASFKKQVTAAGFQLKGSGWYVTDFRGGNQAAAKPDESKDGAAKPEGAAADTAKPDSPKPDAPKADSAPAPATTSSGSAASGTGSGATGASTGTGSTGTGH